jgi:hypothetical protein
MPRVALVLIAINISNSSVALRSVQPYTPRKLMLSDAFGQVRQSFCKEGMLISAAAIFGPAELL